MVARPLISTIGWDSGEGDDQRGEEPTLHKRRDPAEVARELIPGEQIEAFGTEG